MEWTKSSVDDMLDVRVGVRYKLKAAMGVSGLFRADLETKSWLRVVALVDKIPQSLRATRAEDVVVLGLFHRGTCELSARLRSDLLRVGDTSEIKCRIENRSDKRVRGLSAYLYQDVRITPIQGGGDTRVYTFTVGETRLLGCESRETAELVLQLPIGVGSSNVVATHHGDLVHIGYRVRVKASQSLAPSTKVEFPVTLCA
ncbi:hypothetical protein PINS_up012289 [Pythium insidiosum]|nr:hypothetical protein PINS_up012289 [Pythium insidiosum]